MFDEHSIYYGVLLLGIELSNFDDSTLGGGDHGYLGLVLTDEEYATVPGTTPFVAPTYPPPLTIPALTTPVQAIELRERYNKGKCKYLPSSSRLLSPLQEPQIWIYTSLTNNLTWPGESRRWQRPEWD